MRLGLEPRGPKCVDKGWLSDFGMSFVYQTSVSSFRKWKWWCLLYWVIRKSSEMLTLKGKLVVHLQLSVAVQILVVMKSHKSVLALYSEICLDLLLNHVWFSNQIRTMPSSENQKNMLSYQRNLIEIFNSGKRDLEEKVLLNQWTVKATLVECFIYVK